MKQQKKRKRKTGRNDLCPCGSKKKFKHCCLHPAELVVEVASAGGGVWSARAVPKSSNPV